MNKNQKLIDLLGYVKTMNVDIYENLDLAIKVLQSIPEQEFRMSMNPNNEHILLQTFNKDNLEFSVNICKNHVEIFYQKDENSYAYDYTMENIQARIYQIYQFYL